MKTLVLIPACLAIGFSACFVGAAAPAKSDVRVVNAPPETQTEIRLVSATLDMSKAKTTAPSKQLAQPTWVGSESAKPVAKHTATRTKPAAPAKVAIKPQPVVNRYDFEIPNPAEPVAVAPVAVSPVAETPAAVVEAKVAPAVTPAMEVTSSVAQTAAVQDWINQAVDARLASGNFRRMPQPQTQMQTQPATIRTAYVSNAQGEIVTYNPVPMVLPTAQQAMIQQVSACSSCNGGCNTGCDTCNTGCDPCAGGCGVGSCSLGNCCGFCPRWTVGVDAIFLDRGDFGSTKELVSCTTVAGTQKYAANNLSSGGTIGGPRFRLYRHGQVSYASDSCGCGTCGCGSAGCDGSCGSSCGGCSAGGCGGGCGSCYQAPDLEILYFNLNDWNSKFTHIGDITLFGTEAVGVGSAAIKYESQLQNFETNVYHCCGCWTKFLYGFRWMQIDEFASAEAAGTLGSVSRRVNATNDLFGAQVGLQQLLYDDGGHFKVDLLSKIGLFGNAIDRHADFGATDLEKTRASFIGDLQLQGSYQLTCHWAVTTGYQLLWISDAASAPDQLTQAGLTTDSIFYHGANVGLVATY